MDSVSVLYNQVQAWITKPFTQPMDTVSIVLLVGVVMVAIVLWARVLAHLQEVI
jgi:hypothetical protein